MYRRRGAQAGGGTRREAEDCVAEGEDVGIEPSKTSEDERWMREALALADEASAASEVPIGCVLVDERGLVASARNARESDQDPTSHAEVVALRRAAAARGSFRLDDLTCYVTLEPCAMCAGALVLARVRRVVYGARDAKAGAVTSLYGIGQDARLNHTFSVTSGVLERECGERLSRFFGALRAQGKK